MRSLVAEISTVVMTPAIEKPLFSKSNVPFRRYLGCYQLAFETGVVLGFTFRNAITKLAELFSEAGHERELVTFIQGLADERLRNYAEDPLTFTGLGMFAEEKRVRAQWSASDPSLKEEQLSRLEDKLRIPLQTAFQNLQVAVSSGIGLGSAHPELSEKMWKLQYESPVVIEDVERLRNAGLDIPMEVLKPIRLAAREKEIRIWVESFIAQYRPELVVVFKNCINSL